MDIILLQDVDKLGDKFDVVTVKNGYGRNYLIPQGMALINNDTNARRLADYRAREERAESKKLGVYQAVADKLKGKTLKIGAKAGTSGKILPRRITGNSLKYQRKVATAVKRCRHLAMLPYVADLMK